MRSVNAMLFILIISGAFFALSRPALAMDVKELEESYLKIVRATRPAVVKISFTREGRLPGGIVLESESTTTGVIVSSDGTIVTLESRIGKDSKISVSVPGEGLKTAEVTGVDSLTGIAVLKLDGENFAAAGIGNSDGVEPGQFIVAVGNAFGMRGTVYYGSIVGTDRTLIGQRYVYSDMLQISTPVFPGDPGGLIADSDGKVVGIISRAYLSRPRVSLSPHSGRGFPDSIKKRFRQLRESSEGEEAERNEDVREEEKNPEGKEKGIEPREPAPPEQKSSDDGESDPNEITQDMAGQLATRDVNFALPINFVMKIVEKIRLHGYVPRPLLGVTVVPVMPSHRRSLELSYEGAQVSHVREGSPAHRAGIRELDIITKFNSEKIFRIHDLKMHVLKAELGGKVRMTVRREQEEIEVEVELFMEKEEKTQDSAVPEKNEKHAPPARGKKEEPGR